MKEGKLKPIFGTIKITLKSRKYFSVAIISALFMLSLSVYIPSIITPGNSIGYQLSLITWENALLILLFSALFGISMAMHVHATKLKRANKGLMAGESAATGIFGMVGAMFSGPLCASCISIIFSTIGLGGSAALALFSHRTEILAASMMLIIVSIYFAGKRINRFCEHCKI
ncbi:MAG: hypothetical protein HYU56_05150 [Candidatus Aenigmarchaeota archaeon]|nr:hypothetical protein [Candidatus Aenigmarchaeota archaeon]